MKQYATKENVTLAILIAFLVLVVDLFDAAGLLYEDAMIWTVLDLLTLGMAGRLGWNANKQQTVNGASE